LINALREGSGRQSSGISDTGERPRGRSMIAMSQLMADIIAATAARDGQPET
jgi:hypothetical protein